MDWVSDAASKRQFESFAAGASDSLLRTGYLMTGDAGTAEDLVQQTFLRVARRWNGVRLMDHPVAYDLAEFRWALAQLPAQQRAVLVLR